LKSARRRESRVEAERVDADWGHQQWAVMMAES
jgi:hypothetical protein